MWQSVTFAGQKPERPSTVYQWMGVMKSGSLNIEAVRYTHHEVTNAVCYVTISDLLRGRHPNTLAQSWRRGQEGLRQSVFDQQSQIDKPHGCAADPGTIRVLSRRKPGHQNPIKTPWQRHQNPSKSIRIHRMYKPSESIKIDQNRSKSIKINENRSKSIKIDQNLSKSIKIYQNPSESIEIDQNRSKSIKID